MTEGGADVGSTALGAAAPAFDSEEGMERSGGRGLVVSRARSGGRAGLPPLEAGTALPPVPAPAIVEAGAEGSEAGRVRAGADAGTDAGAASGVSD
jgi:hypothetical protein